MARPYDDARYLAWHQEFDKLVFEFLDTEGNDQDDLDDVYETAIENAKENLDG